jgi:hypothetical protein
MALTRNAVVELFWRVHPRLYRWTGGRVGGAIGTAAVAKMADYDEYRTRTSRRIPVVVLERRKG